MAKMRIYELARELVESGLAKDSKTLNTDIINLLVKKGVECTYFDTFEKIENFLINNCKHGDLLITMGAGNGYRIGEDLLAR